MNYEVVTLTTDVATKRIDIISPPVRIAEELCNLKTISKLNQIVGTTPATPSHPSPRQAETMPKHQPQFSTQDKSAAGTGTFASSVTVAEPKTVVG